MVRSFAFDWCVHAQINQNNMFRQSGVTALLDSAMEGYACCVLAYGQTGSGKTYTMSGVEELASDEDRDVFSTSTQGLIPRSMEYLYGKVDQFERGRYTIRASFCEIYNEQVYDLLHVTSDVLPVRWNENNGFFVQV